MNLDDASIVGIGATEFSKRSGRSELQLAVEATFSALDDAGIEPCDVDGMVTFVNDSNDEIDVARNIGSRELTFFERIPYGGGAACATVHHAAMAVASGAANVVVCYRAFNERSGRRFGRADNRPLSPYDWYTPFGLATPASRVAMFAQRYLHDFGATTESFGHVSMAARKHAATNPAAWFYERPITLEEHQNSRWIVEPLRLLDCCQESDGGVAIVVAGTERARDLKEKPVCIRAAAQGSSWNQASMTSFYRPDMSSLPEMGRVGRQLWGRSGLTPRHIQTAILYDHFTPFVLIQLEELGFCGRGEAKEFVKDGNVEIGGELPINTHGGQLGEAYIHGMNGISEGVRQVRGTSVNQVAGTEHVLVTAGTGVPTSGLILGGDG